MNKHTWLEYLQGLVIALAFFGFALVAGLFKSLF